MTQHITNAEAMGQGDRYRRRHRSTPMMDPALSPNDIVNALNALVQEIADARDLHGVLRSKALADAKAAVAAGLFSSVTTTAGPVYGQIEAVAAAQKAILGGNRRRRNVDRL